MNTRINRTKAVISLFSLAVLMGVSGCHKVVVPPVVPPGKFDLKGFYLGMGRKEAEAATDRYVFCRPWTNPTPKEKCYIDTHCWFHGMTVAGKDTESTTLFIKNDQVTALDVTFATEYFVDIAAAFTSQYGKPKNLGKETVKNRFGASFEKATLGWEIKDAAITMSSIDGKVDEGSIHVVAARNSAQMAECLQSAKNSAKNDL